MTREWRTGASGGHPPLREWPGGHSPTEDHYVCIDLETTGTNPARDRIIELGAVRFADGRPVETFSALVRPGRPLPPAVVRLTGLTDDELARHPALEEVLPSYLDFLGDAPLVGHNVRFDLEFLARGAEECGLAAGATGLDTLLLARALLPLEPSHALGPLARGLCPEAAPEHRAASDALCTGFLLERLRAEAASRSPQTLASAVRWLEPAREAMAPLYGFFAAALQAVAYTRHPAHSACAPVPASPVSPVPAARAAAPPAPVIGRGKLTSSLPWAFGPDGLLAGVVPGFEVRPQQAEMCNAILGCMLGGGTLAVEAGTGVGKSLAYLLPALAVAESRGQRVVVSTHTVTLQDQLADKDLPLLALAIGRELRFAVLKGRANYLCLRKWDDFANASLIADEVERAFGLRILFWLERTRAADRAELNLTPEEDRCWELVSSGEDCWGRNCPWMGRCHAEAARQAAARADLVIANHALVCADLAAENRVIPAYEHIVVDEAQHFEDVATEHLGLGASRHELAALAAAAGAGRRGRGGHGRAGALFLLEDNAAQAGGARADGLREGGARGGSPHGGLRALAGRALSAVDDFFALLGTAWQAGTPPGDDAGPSEVRYGPDMAGLPPGSADLGRKAAEGVEVLALEAARQAEGLPPDEGPALELAGLAHALRDRAAALGQLVRADRSDWVYWAFQRQGQANLRGVPIAVGAQLREGLWTKLRSRVAVSATLSVAGRFDHFLERVGLTGPQLPPADTVLLSSPFNYRRQVLLCVPDDLPLPGGTGEAERDYAAGIAEFLARLLPATSGRALVLFTSHRLLRMVYSLIAPELAAAGLNPYAQGIDGGRNRLLRALREEQRTVVFGTSTFWEGIDVRGPQLSCLAIARLPFPRPDDPLVAARQEQLAGQGCPPFEHYSLPQAVLRLKQGFGRLIRSGSDRGAVVILDGRLLQRGYGRTFAASLPPVTWFRGPAHRVVDRVQRWLEETGQEGGVRWVSGEGAAGHGPRSTQ